MSKYVITITADNDGASEAAQTTIRVDLSSGQTRVTDLGSVSVGEGLTSGMIFYSWRTSLMT